jgi:hypothetical protein
MRRDEIRNIPFRCKSRFYFLKSDGGQKKNPHNDMRKKAGQAMAFWPMFTHTTFSHRKTYEIAGFFFTFAECEADYVAYAGDTQ